MILSLVMGIAEELINILKAACSGFYDRRKSSPNLHYSMADIVLSAFSVFYLQAPSFLSHQRLLERKHGSSNLASLFGGTQVPTDNQIRTVLDGVSPGHVNPLFRSGFRRLKNDRMFNEFKVLDDRFLIALDGCQHFSSRKISCDCCSTKTYKEAGTSYHHSFVGASLVAPGNSHALALEPEFITPQDGHTKQDCEGAAVKRWLGEYGAYYGQQGAIFLGDDLYACQPVCEMVLEKGGDFIFVAKPSSHAVLYRSVDRAEKQSVVKKGKRGHTLHYSFVNNVPLNGNKNTLMVNWCQIEERDKTGKTLYKNAFVTSLALTEQGVAEIADCGRARWKVENETFNTLKTKGYNLEHNYGHGAEHLCNLLAALNLLAFSFHTLADLLDKKYRTINARIKCRREYFEEIRTLTKYMLFRSWDHLYDTILDSFKPRDGTSKKR